jgi:hypothetical protein
MGSDDNTIQCLNGKILLSVSVISCPGANALGVLFAILRNESTMRWSIGDGGAGRIAMRAEAAAVGWAPSDLVAAVRTSGTAGG